MKKSERKNKLENELEEESKIDEKSNGTIGCFIDDDKKNNDDNNNLVSNNNISNDKKEKRSLEIDKINKRLEKKYYLGCLDVKWILSKRRNNIKQLKIDEEKKDLK